MANRIRTDDPHGFNKERSSKFHEGSRVRQTPEEGRRIYRPKTLNDKNQQVSSQKFRQPTLLFFKTAGFDIKKPTRVYMLLNKETRSKLIFELIYLTPRWDPNKYYNPGSEWIRE